MYIIIIIDNYAHRSIIPIDIVHIQNCSDHDYTIIIASVTSIFHLGYVFLHTYAAKAVQRPALVFLPKLFQSNQYYRGDQFGVTAPTTHTSWILTAQICTSNL